MRATASCLPLSQALVLRRIVGRLGERRAALIAIAVATVGYIGYGVSTEG